MATRTRTHAESNGAGVVRAEACPYCGQPLLNQSAIRHLETSKRQHERDLQAAAETLAKKLASEHAAELEMKHAKKLAQAETAAARKGREEARTELGKKDRLLTQFKKQIAVQERQIEHLTGVERGDLNEEELLLGLQAAFPDDEIERVGHGRAGGDIVQEVRVRSMGAWRRPGGSSTSARTRRTGRTASSSRLARRERRTTRPTW